MYAIPYMPQYAEIWNVLVKSSRNGTFLFERNFMDYHAERFTDASLLFYKGADKPYKGASSVDDHDSTQSKAHDETDSPPKNAQPLGLLPASAHGKEIVSHGGLTYGGLILSPSAHAIDVGEMLELAIKHYKDLGFESLTLKPIPHIYHSQPSDDELYWLFRHGARLTARSLSTAILLDAPLPFSTLRIRKAKKAVHEGVTIENTTDVAEFETFWDLLAEVLMQQHGKMPVHSLAELLLLHQRFPQNIKLYVAKDAANSAILAGTILFVTPQVVHTQYIASSSRGRDTGALDLLFKRLVAHYSSAPQRYLDFGISTESHGRWLNEGLNFQKEGFGGRSIIYDSYSLPI